MGEGSDGGVGFANARPDEAAGGADAEFDIGREDAEAILEVLSSPDLRDRLGEAARHAAERNLTVERMGERYLRLYCGARANR